MTPLTRLWHALTDERGTFLEWHHAGRLAAEHRRKGLEPEIECDYRRGVAWRIANGLKPERPLVIKNLEEA